MNLLLDTCTVLFLSTNDECVNDQVIRKIQQAERIFISAVTCGELACLCEKGKVTLSPHWRTWFRKAVKINGWKVLPVDWRTMEEAYALPEKFHADPADRMIVATARIHDLLLLTTDRKILDYPNVNTSWGNEAHP